MGWLTQEDLLVEVAARGCPVTPRLLRRWRAMGMVTPPVRRGLGRGRGSVSSYPAHAVDQVVAAASVVRRGRPWHIAIVLAAVDTPVPPPRLAKALLYWSRQLHCNPLGPEMTAYLMESWVEAAGVPFVLRGLDRSTAAEAMGILAGLSLNHGEVDALTPSARAVLAELYERTLEHLAVLFGVELDDDVRADVPRLVEETLEDYRRSPPFAVVERAVEEATPDELIAALGRARLRLTVLRPKRESAEAWALAVAAATCSILAETYLLSGADCPLAITS